MGNRTPHRRQPATETKTCKTSTALLRCCLLLTLLPAALACSARDPSVSPAVEPKINWLPVWEEIDMHVTNRRLDLREEEDHTNSVEEAAEESETPTLGDSASVGAPVLHYVPVQIPLYRRIYATVKNEADTCAATNGAGLKNLLQQAKALLPLNQIHSITAAAVTNDEEVRHLKQVLGSVEFRQKASLLRKSREAIVLGDYVCRVLHLEPRYYAGYMKMLLNLTTSDNAKPPASDFHGRPGVSGLLQDIRDVLPQQELKQLYDRLKASDEYLAEAVEQMKSGEMRQLVRNLREQPEYEELRQMLLTAGLQLSDLKQLVDAALGWQHIKKEHEGASVEMI